MRRPACTNLPLLVLLIAACMPLPAVTRAHAGEGGFRLLEMQGRTVKWGKPQLGAGASVSYAFASETLHFGNERTWFENAPNCRDMASAESLSGAKLTMEELARETAAAFRVWERAASLTFHRVADARNADIVIGAQGQPRRWAFANLSYTVESREGVHTIDKALVCLNPEKAWKVGFDGDKDVYDIRYTLVHEIGHAIGLDHPGPSGQVMAFRYTEAFQDLQPGDLRGVQLLYGPARPDSNEVPQRSGQHRPSQHPDP